MEHLADAKIALETFGRFPGRSLLVVITVAFGVATVAITDGAGRGAGERVESRLARLGKNILVVSAGKTKVVAGRKRQTQYVTSLTLGDVQAIRKRLSSLVVAVAPKHTKGITVRRGNVTHSPEVVATAEDYPRIRNTSVARGRFFTRAEERSRVRVAVLGQRVFEVLYPEGGQAVGSPIRINRIPFRVVGVMEPRGAALSGKDEDNEIYVPAKTALRRLFNVDHISGLLVKFRSKSLSKKTQRRLTTLLRRRHRLPPNKPDDFTIQTLRQVVQARQSIASRFGEILVVVMVVTSLISALGVFAVMTIGVTRRKPEIGLRRALGATKRRILRQFLYEALWLSLCGALVGLSLALMVDAALGISASPTVPPPIPLTLSPTVLISQTALSALLGLLSGLYPAWTAAHLNPVSALRGTRDIKAKKG